MVGGEVGVEEDEEQEEEFYEDKDHVVDVDLVVVHSLFDLEEGFFKDEIDQIDRIEKNYQNQLDNGAW